MDEAPQNPTPWKAAATPKAILNQKYGNKASYRTEEVHDESTRNACPGLAIPQQTQCNFRCHLELPEFTVVSSVCLRKKDAEQSAAKMALEKLGIVSSGNCPTIREQWEDLVARISFLFKDEFLSSPHPLAAHFRAALMQKSGSLNFLPASVLPVCDAKIFNLCKFINPKAEVDPLVSVALIMNAVRQCGSLSSLTGKLWISRQAPYPIEVVNLLAEKHSVSAENIKTGVVYIPCALEKPVEVFDLEVPPNAYYMDVIAQKLCACDSSQVVISRAVGKSSSETRLHFPAPDSPLFDHESSFGDLSSSKDGVDLEPLLNVRASYFSGQNVYGDAILATLGYTWRSTGLFHENVSLSSYYRMLLSRIPDGNYKISRDAILIAELPVDYATRSNWRGSFPRDLLCMFCHQNNLSEPIFSIHSSEPPRASGTHTKSKLGSPIEVDESTRRMLDDEKNGESGGDGIPKFLYRCSIRVLSKEEDVIMECCPTNLYRSKSDAVQNAALKVMGWFNKFFKYMVLENEKLASPEDVDGVNVSISKFSKQFSRQIALYRSLYTSPGNGVPLCSTFGKGQPDILQENGKTHFNIEGPDSGIYASNGSLACISYSIFWLNGHQRKCIDSKDQFEFEMGNGAVISPLEECVSQMSVDQVASFIVPVPCELILASATEAAAMYSSCCPYDGSLEYCIKLLHITEPMEDRMEQAFFSPPLSKQRVEFALRCIRESRALTLVDFGCGSGSLLDTLFQHETTLEKVAGVDISQKSLCRAAKMLYLKLGRSDESMAQTEGIKAAVLYEGSITEFDPRLYGFDIGTCLEVIEHMEEEQAYVFGDLVLSSFCPTTLIVSTPNHEYNAILQRNSMDTRSASTIESQEEGTEGQSYKFRNHDHKFEWTRAQFNQWAFDLASRHNYSVEISGVGGSGDIEPGFASQIAVFRRHASDLTTKGCSNAVSSHIYEVRWEWGSGC